MLKTLEENYNKGVECPSCHEKGEFRQIYVGNDDKGWQETGEWECDSCDYQDIEWYKFKKGIAWLKSNRPKYFNKLPPDVQAARATIELSNEIKNEPVVHQHHEPTFREIQEDKVKLNG
jgi:hypothetical protein